MKLSNSQFYSLFLLSSLIVLWGNVPNLKAKESSNPLEEISKQNNQAQNTAKPKVKEKKFKRFSSKNTEPEITDDAKQDSLLAPVSSDEIEKDNTTSTKQVKDDQPLSEAEKLAKQNDELSKITKESSESNQKTIDAINFIQPSIGINELEKDKIDMALTRAEQEQLTILWRATLERNKTIKFIVQKLAPTDENKKKNQVLSQILNTAIFLPFYALQTVAPTDTSSLASYVGAGLASDLINGKARKNSDKMQLSQTEMVIMFMMIDQVAERVRDQYHKYKQEKIDQVLASQELLEARDEAVAALNLMSPESQFLSQVRIRQIERELRRINLRARSSRIVLVDLSGGEAVEEVDKLINSEMKALISIPVMEKSKV